MINGDPEAGSVFRTKDQEILNRRRRAGARFGLWPWLRRHPVVDGRFGVHAVIRKDIFGGGEA